MGCGDRLQLGVSPAWSIAPYSVTWIIFVFLHNTKKTFRLGIFILCRKQSRKQQRAQTNKKLVKHTLGSRRRQRRRRRTRKLTLWSLRATPPARATSCLSTKSAATRMTIRASACPFVATPSRTRWALSPRTSPPQPNRTTNRHADRGRSAWWVCSSTRLSLTANVSNNNICINTYNVVFELLLRLLRRWRIVRCGIVEV